MFATVMLISTAHPHPSIGKLNSSDIQTYFGVHELMELNLRKRPYDLVVFRWKIIPKHILFCISLMVLKFLNCLGLGVLGRTHPAWVSFLSSCIRQNV